MASLLTLTFSQPTRNLEPGEVLINEGDPGGDIFVLESGRLVVERNGVAIAIIDEPGVMVGEMSVLLGRPNTATVRAEKASAVRVIRDAVAYLERQPLVALRVAELLARRLDATSAALVDSQHGKAPAESGLFERLAAALSGGRR